MSNVLSESVRDHYIEYEAILVLLGVVGGVIGGVLYSTDAVGGLTAASIGANVSLFAWAYTLYEGWHR